MTQVQVTPPTKILDSPPTSTDLLPTVDAQINYNITRIAVNTLGGDPLRIFLYVRNNFHFEPYGGSMKGSFQTLADGGGNDYDLSSLTISLLRAAGIPARYVRTNVSLPGNVTENWVGVKQPRIVASIFSTAGRPYNWYVFNDGRVVFNFTEIMVSAYVSGSWILMDPSFKQQVLAPAQNLSSIMGVNADSLAAAATASASSGSDWFTGVSLEPILLANNYTASNLLSYVQDNPDLTLRQLTGGRTIIAADSYTTPSSVNVLGTSEQIPYQQRHFLQIFFPSYDDTNASYDWRDNSSLTVPTAALGQNQISLSFVPQNQTVTHYVNDFPKKLFDPDLNSSRVLMYPQLRINGSFFLAGQPGPAGAPMQIAVKYIGPLGTRARTVHFTPYVGGYYNIAVDFGEKYRWDALGSKINQANVSIQAALSGTPTDIDLIIGRLLYGQGQTFFDMAEFLDSRLASLLGIVQLSNPSVALTGYDVRQESGHINEGPLVYGGMMIDVQLNGAYPGFSVVNDTKLEFTFDSLRGIFDSEAEGSTLAMLYQNAPVSTVEVLQAADQTGVPIYTLDKSNLQGALPGLSIRQATKDVISSWVGQGFIVLVPQRIISLNVLTVNASESSVSIQPLRTWTGIAYMTIDPKTGDTGSFIQQGALTETGDASPVAGGGEAITSGPSTENQDVFASLGIEGGSTALDLTANALEQFGATEAAYTEATHTVTDYTALGMVSEVEGEVLKPASDGLGFALSLTHYAQDYMAIMDSDPTGSTPLRDAGAVATAGLLTFGEYAIPEAMIAGTFPAIATLAVAGGPLGLLAAGGYMLAVGGAIYSLGSTINDLRKQNLNYYGACSNAYEVCKDPPFLDLYLQDPGGAISGANVANNGTAMRIQGSIYYSGAGTMPQVLQVLDPPPGDYVLTMVGTKSPSDQFNLGIGIAVGQNQSSTARVGSTIEDGQTLRMQVRIGYGAEGRVTISASNPLPASFITISSMPSTSSGAEVAISARLVGPLGMTGLSGKSVDLSYRAAGEFAGHWIHISTLTTESDGTFSISWTPPTAGAYYVNASYAGDGSTFGISGFIMIGNGGALTPPNGFPYWLLYVVVASSLILALVFLGRGRLSTRPRRAKVEPTKYCRYCGRPCSQEAIFCKYCGRSFQKPAVDRPPSSRHY